MKTYLSLIAVALLLSGYFGYEEELQEQALYCEMVGEGFWGDYKENYGEVCKGFEDTKSR